MPWPEEDIGNPRVALNALVQLFLMLIARNAASESHELLSSNLSV
jgi:hypothetical protein